MLKVDVQEMKAYLSEIGEYMAEVGKSIRSDILPKIENINTSKAWQGTDATAFIEECRNKTNEFSKKYENEFKVFYEYLENYISKLESIDNS